MRFTKMHGAGNDYVYVDLFEEAVDDAAAVSRAVSDRHTGIGADGLILMAPPTDVDSADIRMVMYNADGSRAQMCGNGIRCLARLARDHGHARSDEVTVETDAGIKHVVLTADGARVDMGVPALEPAALPVRLDGERIVNHELEVLGVRFPITCVSMGNPHTVVYIAETENMDVARYGAAIETDELFPERTNVEFVEVLDRSTVRQRTWERGSGETLACGTGACAVAVAGVLTGRTDSPLRNHLRGGDLLLEWAGEGQSVFMTGPAVEVFSGEWPGDGV